MISLGIRYLKSYLPILYDIVTFIFLIKVLQLVAQKYQDKIEFFCFFVDQLMIRLSIVT